MGAAIVKGVVKGLANLGGALWQGIMDAIAGIHIELGWIVIDGRNGVKALSSRRGQLLKQEKACCQSRLPCTTKSSKLKKV